MEKEFILLIKGQLYSESRKRFKRLDAVKEYTFGEEFKHYLRTLNKKNIENCKTEDDLDNYISDSTRTSLKGWLESLSEIHIK